MAISTVSAMAPAMATTLAAIQIPTPSTPRVKTAGGTPPIPLLSSVPPTCAICRWGELDGGGGGEGGVSLFLAPAPFDPR